MGNELIGIMRVRAAQVDEVAQRLEVCRSAHIQQEVLTQAQHLRAIARGMRGDALYEEREAKEGHERRQREDQARTQAEMAEVRERIGPVREKWL